MFEEINTRSILARVPVQLQDEKARSLWRRLDSELSSGGGLSAESYLKAQFAEVQANVRHAMSVVKDSTHSSHS